MRLISLRLRQWRSYEDCAIEFPDGLIGVRGQNGAGKSTIAEAIGWALFGRLRARAKVGDLRRQGAPKGSKSVVEFEFQLGSSNYRIERTVAGDAKLWINGQLETQKVTDTNSRVAQELDMTWEVFQRTVFAQQKDVAALDPGASADQRKSHVERLLGLERYKTAATRARGDMKLRSAELGALREAAPDVGEIKALLKEAEEQAAKGDPAVDAARAKLDQATKQRDDARKKVETEQEKRRQFELISQRQKSENQALSGTEETAANLTAKLSERTRWLSELKKLAPEAAKLKVAEKTLSLWDGLSEDVSALESTNAALAKIPYIASEAKKSRQEHEKLAAEQTQLLQRRPALDTQLNAAKARLDALRAAAKAGAPEQAKLVVTGLDATVRKAREELAVARAELAHDQSHVDDVADGGPRTPCPICKKPYGEEYDNILDGYRSRIGANKRLVPELEAKCGQLDSRLEQAREAQVQARTATRKLAETTGAANVADAEETLAGAKAELAKVDQRLKALAVNLPKLAKECAANESNADEWRELDATRKEKERNIERVLKTLGRARYSQSAHERAQSAYERVVAADEEAGSLKQATADTSDLKIELEKVEKSLASGRAALKQTAAELQNIDFDEKRLQAAKKAAEISEEMREQAKEGVTQARLEAQARSGDVKALRDRLAEAKAAQDAVVAKTTEARQYEVAASLLSKFRDQQARRAWPRLEQLASTLLASATDGRYADVKLSSDYRLMIVDRGEDHELARFSGGEQDLANLCLRLAIADWVSKERSVDLGFVVLDEVFGSQDDERRQRLLSELRALSGRFRQMLVITHLSDIADLCDSQLEVSLLEPGRSSAVVA
jgi:exonuclease SbcC